MSTQQLKNGGIIVNETNLSAATRYYPTDPNDGGRDVRRLAECVYRIAASGGVTITFEASMEDRGRDGIDAASVVWYDITDTVVQASDMTDGHASFADSTDVYRVNVSRWAKLRIVAVTSDTSNALRVTELGIPLGGSMSTEALATQSTLAALAAKIPALGQAPAAASTPVVLTALQEALLGGVYRATQATLQDGVPVQLGLRHSGAADVDLTIAANRVIQLEVAGATTIVGSGTLVEGPCDGISCDTDDVIVFCELRQRLPHIAAASAWTLGANWTRNGDIFTHTAGAVEPLTMPEQTLSTTIRPLLANVPYAVKYNVVTTAGTTVVLAIGNAADSARAGAVAPGTNYICALKSTTTGALTITPALDWAGSIDISQMRIGGHTLLPSHGVEKAISATRILGCATKAAPTTLIASPATAIVTAVWYRRMGAVEVV